MREIVLYSICMENFRSFHASTQIDLSPMAGLKFLSGANQVEPRLGANGAGKSTLWDALAYCLYGSSVKGVRASDLVTWGEKQPLVSTIWNIDGEAVTIERRGSPNLLTINEVPVEQADVDAVIGLSRARFLQSVIFGQSVPLFIDLGGPERGVLLDEVLDLGLWLKAAERASIEQAAAQKELDAIERTLAYTKGKLEGLESLESIQVDIDDWQAAHEMRFLEAAKAVEDAEAELTTAEHKVITTNVAANQQPALLELNKRVSILQTQKGIREAEYRIWFADQQTIQNRIKFYEHSRVCETCMQTIDPVFVRVTLTKLTLEKQTLEMKIKTNGAQQRQLTQAIDQLAGEQDKLRRKSEFLIEQRANAVARYQELERLVESAVNVCRMMIDTKNPHTSRLQKVTKEREEASQRYNLANRHRFSVATRDMRMDFWKAAFKRVRLFMVKRALAQLELETASSAAALGLIGWTIKFATELETKSGTVRPGIHITVASPIAAAPWEAWSGGEGQRIRLAVALGLASMIQRMAGVSIGFEVYDEPTAHLGTEGIDDLFECLRHRVFSTGKSVWICDHRALSHSGFSEIWQAIKTDTGSTIALISNQEA